MTSTLMTLRPHHRTGQTQLQKYSFLQNTSICYFNTLTLKLKDPTDRKNKTIKTPNNETQKDKNTERPQ